jgi:hypothetical protein
LNGADLSEFTDLINQLPDFNTSGIIDTTDEAIFDSIYAASIGGWLDIGFFDLPTTQVQAADINRDGIISIKDRTLLQTAVAANSANLAYDIDLQIHRHSGNDPRQCGRSGRCGFLRH